ncbi:MAG: hypothetical protein HY760_01440 [Nitrospirae bacterium]|nr:hypothetical protein [Nitrospirota bacterium]
MEIFRALRESHEFSYKEVKFRSEEGEFLSKRFTISRTPTAVINDHTLFSIYP